VLIRLVFTSARLPVARAISVHFREHARVKPATRRRRTIVLQIVECRDLPVVGDTVAVDLSQNFFSARLVVLLVSRAERLARERSQFAAAAAHELRTPLAGLQLYGDMLADGLGDPSKLRDYARRMSEEASRLGRGVSNVRGFSPRERGNLSIDARPGNLGAALCELAERAQPALDRAGAALALDVPPELPAKYDRDALARIVGNLLDNAVKFGRDAEDRTIGLAARDAGDHLEVLVTDHGPGVAPAARSKLFRAFSRGVSSDGPAGLGLGLALSQSLARAMGGDLEHRPGPARGATFVLRLGKP
jgi:signal transduction histidine kinase